MTRSKPRLSIFDRNICLSAIVSLFISIIIILSATLCYADGCSPLQISLVPDAQLVSKESTICGVSLNFIGQNSSVMGIDVGLANYATNSLIGIAGAGVNIAESLKGIEIGGFNYLSGNERKESWGIQIAGINYTGNSSFIGGQFGFVNLISSKASIAGIQMGAINSNFSYPHGGDMDGIQIGFFNFGPGNVNGLQIALGNSANNVNGVQIALIENLTDGHVNGIQVGLFNWCESLKGLQIGLINVVAGRYPDKGLFVSPFINVGF